MKKKVGITGQAGFIGSHLTFLLQAKADDFEIVPFSRDFFQDDRALADFVAQCDVVVHLAAMNRGEPEEIHACNVRLVQQLIAALETRKHTPHVIFSSSVQEENDNVYGASKREGRRLFEEWSGRTGAIFSGLSIPNVFGAFGRPFYNSVVATFCHQVTHGQTPEIKVDAAMHLVYVNDLAATICEVILTGKSSLPVTYPVSTRKVSEVLALLQDFREHYMLRQTIPPLAGHFEVSLFNTFRTYIKPSHYPVKPEVHSDQRGWLAEVIKTNTSGQTFFSVTKPGITRGNHYHTRKIERFCVVQGEGVIRLRKIDTDEVIEYHVTGDAPGFVDMPIFHTHHIQNTGSTDLLTLFWTNELFDPADTDTFFREV